LIWVTQRILRWRVLFGRMAAFALLLPLILVAASAPGPAADLNTLEIVSKSGVHVFAVELAVTDDQRARGLMFRRELAEGHGMLFKFEPDQTIVMWMQNTYVSLDMIFIRSDGRILRIAENTEPLSTRTISSGAIGMFSKIALAEQNNRSMCSLSLKTRPL